MKSNCLIGVMVCLVISFCCATSALAQTTKTSNYRGWDAAELSNGLIEVQVVPQIGGRVIQYKLGDFEFFFVNEQLAGKSPPPSGLGPDGEWLNYGGEKLWPAPQGWDNDQQWPGPPDAVLDGSPHRAITLAEMGDSASVELISQEDPRSGIQFSRKISVFPDSTRVRIEARMKNIDTKPRRWGIWSNLQQDAAGPDGKDYEKKLRVYCPINPKSVFPKGYEVMFGLANNTSWQPNQERKMMRVHFRRRVGKIGMDCSAGWMATVNGSAGRVFVQRFPYFADKVYPDRSSVEIWLHGLGEFIADGKINDLKDDPVDCPYFIETETLGPLTTLKPGESTSFTYDWYAAAIGGDYPVLDCSEVGVVCEPFTARRADGKLTLGGRFGVFHEGTAGLVFRNADGKEISRARTRWPVTPNNPLLLSSSLRTDPLPPGTASVELVTYDKRWQELGSLASATVQAAKPKPKGMPEAFEMSFRATTKAEAIAWQEKGRKRMLELVERQQYRNTTEEVPIDFRVEKREDRGDYSLLTASFQANDKKGPRFRCLLSLPKGEGPFPAMLCLHGHGGSAEQAFDYKTIFRGFADRFARGGYVVLAPSFPHRRYAAVMLRDLFHCLDVLRSRSEVDGKRIGVAGLSMGGEWTMWIAVHTAITSSR